MRYVARIAFYGKNRFALVFLVSDADTIFFFLTPMQKCCIIRQVALCVILKHRFALEIQVF